MTLHPGGMSDQAQTVSEILTRHQGLEGTLLPILHDVQDAFGYVPEDVLPQIAQALMLSKAEIWGVVTFYHDFRQKPAGRHVVKICRAEACQAVGADLLSEKLMAKLGLDWHQTSQDGRVTLEPVFCLGLCACGPSAMIDGKLVARLDEQKLDQIIGGLS